MRVLNRDQMREADRRTIDDLGVSSAELMERAGRQVVAAMGSLAGPTSGLRVSVLCGRGHNGGDGFVIARALIEDGGAPRVFVAGALDRITGDPRLMLDRLRDAGGDVTPVVDEAGWTATRGRALDADLVVDALTGTGLEAPATGLVATIIEDVNRAGHPVVAVDLPSGLSADHAAPIGPAIRAALTVTFAAPKIPLVQPPADDLAGSLVVADIGIPDAVIEALPGPRVDWITTASVRPFVTARGANTNKGDFGRVAIVAGSQGRTGAAALAGIGALRGGAGLVTVATPASCQGIVAGYAPEYMTEALPEIGSVLEPAAALDRVLALRADVVAAGPGLGASDEARDLVRGLVDRVSGPLVLDADALNALAGEPARLAGRRGRVTVVTPHPGEMARLVRRSVDDVQGRRLDVAREFAAAHGVIVVLKGHRTVIAAPDGAVRINSTGNPGMATAGAGDVLTGIVAARLCGAIAAVDAVTTAVFLHGLAGDLAADAAGESALIASDIVDRLGAADRVIAPASPRRGAPA